MIKNCRSTLSPTFSQNYFSDNLISKKSLKKAFAKLNPNNTQINIMA